MSKCTKSTNGGSTSGGTGGDGVDNINKNGSLSITTVIGTDGLLTEFTFSGAVQATESTDELHLLFNLVDPQTNSILWSKLLNISGPFQLGATITIPATTITGSELQELLIKLADYAAKAGITLKDLLPKLIGYIETHGIKTINGVKIPFAAWIIAQGLKPQPLQEPENPPVAVPIGFPYAKCIIDKEVIQPQEKVNVFYTTNVASASVTVTPGKNRPDSPSTGYFTLKPSQDTSVSVTAANILGTVTTECKVDVTDKKPSEITGYADHQFFYGKNESNLDKAWDYPVAFKVNSHDVGFDYVTGLTAPVRVTPGQYSTSLVINNVETIMNNVTVAEGEQKKVEHSGGVFRHYGTGGPAGKIAFIKTGMTFPISSFGDLYIVSPPEGAGVYLTDLNITPDTLTNRTIIARILRLLNVDNLQGLISIKVGEEKDEQLLKNRNANIDVLVDTDIKTLLKDSNFKNQFLYPLPLIIDSSSTFEINSNSY